MRDLIVEAVAPATSANLGAGFDVFGVALDGPHDSVRVEKLETEQIEISIEGIGADFIPREPQRNTAGIVASALLSQSKEKGGLKIRITKGIKPGSGLGSSAASAAAAALAVSELLELRFTKTQLIEIAAQGETASAGVAHADNVAPAILGFFTIIQSYNPLEATSLPSPRNVVFVLAIPEYSKSTATMRAVLPKQVSLSDLVHNVGHAASFIAGIALGDVALMGRGMADSIVEPVRAGLLPGVKEVKKEAIEAGAAGVALSGAGPSVLALVDSEKGNAESIAKAMRNGFASLDIGSQAIIVRPGPGAKIVRRRAE